MPSTRAGTQTGTPPRGSTGSTGTALPDGSIGSALRGRSIAICCGSGGVGKTTTAAAVGTIAALRDRRRVLVLTIDPAKRLAAALGLDGVGNEATRVVGMPRGAGELWVAMLDTSAGWDSLVRRHAPDPDTCARILANPLYRNITQRFVQSHDYIAMERLYELHVSGDYDLIVIDTPPSRHALDFLDAPERMAEFFSSSLLRWITLPYRVGGERAGRLGYLAAKPFYQVADRILGSQFLKDIAEFFLLFQTMYEGFVTRARSVTTLLHDPATTFLVVSTLEPSPLHEAEFFISELAKRRLHLGALVLNKVLPEWLLDPAAKALATRVVDAAGRGPTSEAARIALAVAENHLRFAQLAEAEAGERRRLGAQPEVLCSVPQRTDELSDLGGLRSLGETLWP